MIDGCLSVLKWQVWKRSQQRINVFLLWQKKKKTGMCLYIISAGKQQHFLKLFLINFYLSPNEYVGSIKHGEHFKLNFHRNHSAAASWLAGEIRYRFGISHGRPLENGARSDTVWYTPEEKPWFIAPMALKNMSYYQLSSFWQCYRQSIQVEIRER